MGQQQAAANLVIFLFPLAFAFVFGFFALNAYLEPYGFAYFTLGLYGLGLTLFLVAKLSLLRRGIPISFGSARMSPWNRRAYRSGYALMLVGAFATFVLVEVLSSV